MAAANPDNVTALVQVAGSGDPNAASSLLSLLYRELRWLAARRLAQEPAGQTLQATALVHEAYLRLVESGMSWSGRGHFFGAAARAMRCILIDRARARKTQKRGGQWRRRDGLREVAQAEEETPRDEILALDAALNRLEQRDTRKAQIVMLRYFAGLNIEEVAAVLDLSPTTVKDEWFFARAWLQAELGS